MTELQGANLSEVRLQAAWLSDSQLQGANLSGARLQGAIVGSAKLQGANLHKAQLGGTALFDAQLQGALFHESFLAFAMIVRPSVWRARGAKCDDAYVEKPTFEPVSHDSEDINSGMERFIEQVVRELPQPMKQEVGTTLRERLTAHITDDDLTNEQLWRACEAKAVMDEDHDGKFVSYLAEVVCNESYFNVPWDIDIGIDSRQRKYVAEGIFRLWIQDKSLEDMPAQTFARRVLGSDGQPCRGAKELDEKATQRLRRLIGAGN
jgi:Pentapeptide repeats (8 copies)